jgi:hypothetical protein
MSQHAEFVTNTEREREGEYSVFLDIPILSTVVACVELMNVVTSGE